MSSGGLLEFLKLKIDENEEESAADAMAVCVIDDEIC